MIDPKRAVDVVGATVLLVVASPVLALAAAAIVAESPGGVLFRQERVGRDGRVFRMRKLRTMRPGPGSLVTVAGDDRVTRVGAVLRATKIDELPQLMDVIEGKMSLVGPRPEVPRFVALWPDELRPIILSVRPGITDPMSVELRHESDLLAEQDDPEQYYIRELLPRKAQGYAEYVTRHSLRGDARIVLDTLKAVAKG